MPSSENGALLSARTSQLLVIDVQQALMPAIPDSQALILRIARLVQAANLLGIPVGATEHCVDRIGPTVEALRPHIGHVAYKTHFNACREADFPSCLPTDRPRVLLVGTEAHVCVLQTGLGLAQAGWQPVLVTDCIGSRRKLDWRAACARWQHYGLETVSAEMAMFEWLEVASHPQFREVLALIKANA